MAGYYSIMGKDSFDSHKETLGKIFKGGDVYEVPPNQRDYEWSEDLLEYFWDDLINSLNAHEKSYFFGSVIFQKDDGDTASTIYDGQQRLATLTILWAVIRDMLFSFNERETAQTINTSYINQMTEKKKQTPILTLNLRNKDFFSECIQQYPRKSFEDYEKIKAKKLSKSNNKVKNCFLFFQTIINKEFENRKFKTNQEKIDFITDISEHLKENFVLVIIDVKDEDEAYMVYEAINQKR